MIKFLKSFEGFLICLILVFSLALFTILWRHEKVTGPLRVECAQLGGQWLDRDQACAVIIKLPVRKVRFTV